MPANSRWDLIRRLRVNLSSQIKFRTKSLPRQHMVTSLCKIWGFLKCINSYYGLPCHDTGSMTSNLEVANIIFYETLVNTCQPRLWHLIKKKVKQSHYRPGQALRVPEVEAPRFQDSRHMKVVRLSGLRIGRLYHQEIFLVLISVRGWVNPKAIVQPVG